MVNNPSISVNKLAEYIVSKAARQRSILTERKYPNPDFNAGIYHREAAEAVQIYIANGAIDQQPLINAQSLLEQITTDKVGTARRISGNIDAIERFMGMLDDIDLMGAEAEMGANSPNKLTFHNVEISVRPEIVLRGDGPKGKKLIGAWKLHFSKTKPLTEDAASYVSAIVQEYCKLHLADGDEVVNPAYCKVIDVASGIVFSGVKSTTARLKDVAAECQNISALWPSI